MTCGLLGVATVCGSVFAGEEKSKEQRQRNGVLGGLMAAAGWYRQLQLYPAHSELYVRPKKSKLDFTRTRVSPFLR